MRRELVFVAVVACGGCARLIGAQFDDAKLGEDAAAPDDAATVDELAQIPDVLEPETSPITDASTFDVFAPGDLQLWLAADRGVTQAFPDAGDAAANPEAGPNNGVVAWQDLSGHGHGGVQALGSARPALVANARAGKPVVWFERARRTCLTTTWTASPGGVAATIFAVTQGSPDSLLRFQGTLPGVLIFPFNESPAAPPPDLRFYLSGGPAIAVRMAHDRSAYDVMTARVDPNVVGGAQTWRNGKLVEQSSLFADAMPVADVLTIGCHPSGIQFADGNVAEVLYYNAALGDAARSDVEAYLRDRWAVVF